MRVTSFSEGTLQKSTECLKVMSFYSLGLASGGGGPPILKVFVHQIVIFTVEAPPPEAKVGSAAVPCNSLTLFTLARVSGNRPILQSIAWEMTHEKIGTGRQ